MKQTKILMGSFDMETFKKYVCVILTPFVSAVLTRKLCRGDILRKTVRTAACKPEGSPDLIFFLKFCFSKPNPKVIKDTFKHVQTFVKSFVLCLILKPSESSWMTILL